jgi:hypothetical protein
VSTSAERAVHWNEAYVNRGTEGVSWFQTEPTVSLELIEALEVAADTASLDVGGGASVLVDRLVDSGFSDLTVLDLSSVALDASSQRLGPTAPVTWLQADILGWRPTQRFGLWHDRAVFHFLTAEDDRAAYLEALYSGLEPGGVIVMATFAEDGPEYCSGLPVSRYSIDELASTLGSGFELLKSLREVHTTPTGATQSFSWVAGRLSR